jgi:hypothetical protein
LYCTGSLRHSDSLPYTDAVLMEVQRMNTIAPLTAPHRATKDTKLLGYNIPKVKILEIKLFTITFRIILISLMVIGKYTFN